MIAERFKAGDLVTWNSEAGRVSGTFIKVHTIGVDYKGHTRYASEDDPRYEIKGQDRSRRRIKAIIHFCIQGWSGVANELGFKMVKWIAAIEFVHDFADLAPVKVAITKIVLWIPYADLRHAAASQGEWSGVANELGFKMVKWIAAIEFVHDFADLGAGQGGYNEDHEFYGYRMPI
jgi:DUF2945 family protein